MNPIIQHKRIILLCASLLIFTAIFGIARSPFYYYSSLASIQPDSTGYAQMALSIKTGQPLDLSYRTLGYPVFLWLAGLMKNSWSFAVTLQVLISFAASVILIFSVYSLSPYASLPTALCIAAFQFSGTKTTMDCAILTDSLYSSSTMICFAFLIFAFKFKRSVFYGLSAIFCGMSIYFRPTGLILLLMLFFAAGYQFYFNKEAIKKLLLLVVPPIILILPVYFYNWWDYGDFTFSSGSSMTLSITTGSFLEKNETFPLSWNEAIETINKSVDPRDREIILNSWDIDKFYASYHKYFACDKIWRPLSEAAPTKSENFKINKKVALNAIKAHPSTYKKIVLFNAYKQIFRYSNIDIDYLTHLQDIYRIVFIERSYDNIKPQDYVLKEYSGLGGLDKYSVKNGMVTAVPSLISQVYLIVLKGYRTYFMSEKWGYILFFTMITSLILLITGLRKDIYFVCLFLSSFVFLHILGVSLFTVGELRMPQAVVFANYVSFVLLCAGMIGDTWGIARGKRSQAISG
jgi:hypothetical protein